MHNLEERNGRVSYVGVRNPPWHGLGKTVDALTLDEAFEEGGLNFNVSKCPALMQDPVTGEYLTVPDQFVTYRTDGIPAQPLGVVGSKYQVVQNREGLAFLASLIGADHKAETAGVLGKGERVFISVRMDPYDVLPGDTVESFALFSTSHDGSCGVTCAVTPIRVVCQNTLTMAIKGATRKRNIRHTASATDRIKEVAASLKLVEDHATAMKNLAAYLTKTKVNDETFAKLTFLLWEGESTRAENLRSEVTRLWQGAGIQIQRGTAWGALNAVTEYLSHKAQDPATRFLSLTEGDSVSKATKASDFLVALGV